MKIVCGVDIGNSTTEVTIGSIDNKNISFIGSSRVKTTGIKGTVDNVIGVKLAINEAIRNRGLSLENIDVIKINEASPVIGDNTMETISETIIIDSAIIGHNPDTPGGEGIACGKTILLDRLRNLDDYKFDEYIVVVNDTNNYEDVANKINNLVGYGVKINGAILQEDEGVLVSNRLNKKIPIVDEVLGINKIPMNMPCAIEVASLGKTTKVLCNPYGLAEIFKLTAEEIKKVVPISKGLIGLKSGVVIKTPKSDIKENKLKAGILKVFGKSNIKEVDIDNGGEAIMKALDGIGEIQDVSGEEFTNISIMLNSMKSSMEELTNISKDLIKIKDILAVDTVVQRLVKGGIAGEKYFEKSVAIAAMVKTHKLPLNLIKEKLQRDLEISVEINGIEGVMATLGALTTRGTKLPIAVVDIGGGSTDIAILDKEGRIVTKHLAGAGELVTMLINLELGLEDRNLAEEIKKNIVGKVESLYTLRLETGEIKFFNKPLNPKFFGRVVIIKEKELIPIYKKVDVRDIVRIRRKIKEKVFIKNIIRGLKDVSPMDNIHDIPNIVLVGGSALDFEIPDMVVKELSDYGVVSGCGNIRNCEGPRHAVSTGLVLNCINEI